MTEQKCLARPFWNFSIMSKLYFLTLHHEHGTISRVCMTNTFWQASEQNLWDYLINWLFFIVIVKVENIQEDSLDSIPSPTTLVKIQIIGGKVCLRCKGKTLLGVVKKLLKTKSLLTSHCWALSTNFWKQKGCWHHPAMFCLITSSEVSWQ